MAQVEPEPSRHTAGSRRHADRDCVGRSIPNPASQEVAWVTHKLQIFGHIRGEEGVPSLNVCLPEVSGGQISHKAEPPPPAQQLWSRGTWARSPAQLVMAQLPGQARSQLFSHYTMILPADPECLSGVGCVG